MSRAGNVDGWGAEPSQRYCPRLMLARSVVGRTSFLVRVTAVGDGVAAPAGWVAATPTRTVDTATTTATARRRRGVLMTAPLSVGGPGDACVVPRRRAP